MSRGGSSYLIDRRQSGISEVVSEEVAHRIHKKEQGVTKTLRSTSMANLVINSLRFTRPPKTLTINIGTTPTLILKPPHELPYIFANPSLSIGVTSSNILIGSTGPIYQTINAAGNSQANPIGVSSYAEMHMHFRVNSIVGTPSLNIYTQSKDPGSGEWFDIQTLFSGITGVGNYYASIGNFGIVTDFAIRWDGTLSPVVPGPEASLACMLTTTLKGGTEKAAGGLARTIYIGGPDVNSNNGYPIFEGQTTSPIELAPDMALYAIAGVPTTLKLFTI